SLREGSAAARTPSMSRLSPGSSVATRTRICGSHGKKNVAGGRLFGAALSDGMNWANSAARTTRPSVTATRRCTEDLSFGRSGSLIVELEFAGHGGLPREPDRALPERRDLPTSWRLQQKALPDQER